MKKLLAAALLVLGAAAWASAEVKTVPPGLLAWYKDAMAMYTGLIQGLDQAQSAADTAAAFDKAAGVVRTQKLGPRYRDLKAQYPDFFRHADSGDPTWVPPADWIKVSQDYAKALQTYSQGMRKAMAYGSDPAVRKALKDFSAAMKELSGDE